MIEYHPFEPIVFEDSKILVLGSFPSFDSFKNSFYYGHKHNQFWRLLADIFNDIVPNNIEEKIIFLKKHKIALWDMVKSCKRESSLDSTLKHIEINDIETFLKENPSIEKIYFTGRKSQELFEKNFSHLNIKRYYLPSPSPAYRKLRYEEKLKIWRKLIKLGYEKSTDEK
ncbi:DNA-deoxyinosine glycosylase [Nitrosophilus labii]|uniref:DNA-deoxyinosine glycosylase n=1 Tax=Nitrosophilus labii TaxID=2706014 RepID=UPI0016570FC0|nr:DNA-deoxyinosine glycosylase [Nitrosophilus labii]